MLQKAVKYEIQARKLMNDAQVLRARYKYLTDIKEVSAAAIEAEALGWRVALKCSDHYIFLARIEGRCREKQNEASGGCS